MSSAYQQGNQSVFAITSFGTLKQHLHTQFRDFDKESWRLIWTLAHNLHSGKPVWLVLRTVLTEIFLSNLTSEDWTTLTHSNVHKIIWRKPIH